MGEDLKSQEEKEDEELEYEEEEDEYDYEVSLPKVINWVDENGKSVYGVEMINYYNEKKKKMKKEFIRGELELCPICSQSWTSNGPHRICCLPCGHIYGMSCIKKWLQQDFQSSSRKCPQCNKLCTLKDVKVLYATRLQAAAKISTTRFPFTEKGFEAFKLYVLRQETDALVRRSDALKLRAYVWAQNIDLLKRTTYLLDSRNDGLRQRDNVLEKWADSLDKHTGALEWRAESLEQQAYALELRAESLERRADALERRADALEQQACALDQRADAFRRRAHAYKASMNFFEERYKEHMGQDQPIDVETVESDDDKRKRKAHPNQGKRLLSDGNTLIQSLNQMKMG